MVLAPRSPLKKRRVRSSDSSIGGRPRGVSEFSSRDTLNSGLAFVLVQHLEPTQRACLPSCWTPHRNAGASDHRRDADRAELRLPHPSERSLSIANAILRLSQFSEPRGFGGPSTISSAVLPSIRGPTPPGGAVRDRRGRQRGVAGRQRSGRTYSGPGAGHGQIRRHAQSAVATGLVDKI